MNNLNFKRASIYLLLTLLLIPTAYAQKPFWQHKQNTDEQEKYASTVISTYAGHTHINFNAELIADLNLSIEAKNTSKDVVELPKAMWGEILSFDILAVDNIDFLAPYGSFEDFTSGRVVHKGGFNLILPNTRLDVTGFSIRTHAQKYRVLEMTDNVGQVLFELKIPRVVLDVENSSMKILEMSLQISDYLAEIMGNSRLAGLSVGTVAMDTHLLIPKNVDLSQNRGGACAGRPFWPNQTSEVVDVGFTDLVVVYKRRRADGQGGYEAMFAPSSSLINLADGAVGADVPWYGFYSGSNAPYNNSQHPFLVWSLYRKMHGRIEQIGRSGMKHAFLTINVGCNNCGSSHILWPQCQDTYSSENNDSNYYLGPRIELESSAGIFQETPSFFDPSSAGAHTNSSTNWQNRLVVNETELDLAGAEYIFDSWYLARDDVNIFNTMGYRYIDLNFSGSSWSVTHLSPNTLLGSVMNSWGTGGANEQTVNLTEDAGHLRLDVIVSDIGNGTYHYEYALTNFDYDPQVNTFTIDLPAGINAQNVGFSAPQGYLNLSTYKYEPAVWNITQVGSQLRFSASDAGHMLDWGGLYNFYFDADVAPAAGMVNLTSGEIVNDIDINILAPGANPDIIFMHGFE